MLLQPRNRTQAFFGSNESTEIETLDEFLCRVDGCDPTQVSLQGWVFQEVDFSALSPEEFSKYNFAKASLWGCTLPDGISAEDLRARGATVLENSHDVPFKVRSPLFTSLPPFDQLEIIWRAWRLSELLCTPKKSWGCTTLPYTFGI